MTKEATQSATNRFRTLSRIGLFALAAAAMALSSVSVIGNALLLNGLRL